MNNVYENSNLISLVSFDINISKIVKAAQEMEITFI